MSSVTIPVVSGQGAFETRLAVTAEDGATLLPERRGDSLVGHFAARLRAMFAGEYVAGGGYGIPAPSVYGGDIDATTWTDTLTLFVGKTGSASGGKTLIYISGLPDAEPWGAFGYKVMISGHSDLPEIHGRFSITRSMAYDANTLPDRASNVWVLLKAEPEDSLDFVTPSDPTHNAVWEGSVPTAHVDRITLRQLSALPTHRPQTEVFGLPRLRVGYGDDPVQIDDDALAREYVHSATRTDGSTLVYGPMTIRPPSVGAGYSEVEFRTTVTNTGLAPRNVTEVGLFATSHFTYPSNNSNVRHFVLVARDLMGTAAGEAAVTLAPGQTLTIYYKVRTNTTAAGGILIQFNECMYRQWAQVVREAKDVLNENITQGPAIGQFLVASPGGPNKFSIQSTSVAGQFVGLQAGKSNKPVVVTDFRLQYAGGEVRPEGGEAATAEDSRFVHGYGPNQLLNYAPEVGPYVVDTNANRASFEVTGFLENASGQPVTVREIGLYHSLMDGYQTASAHCMARHVLDVPVVVSPGELLRVSYEFQFDA